MHSARPTLRLAKKHDSCDVEPVANEPNVHASPIPKWIFGSGVFATLCANDADDKALNRKPTDKRGYCQPNQQAKNELSCFDHPRITTHVTDIQRSLDPLADLVRSAGINAYACEPLLVRGELLGTLSFASRSRRRFDADDLTFFRIIAKHLAMARSSAPYRAGLSTSTTRNADAALA
jgi:GAF domain-containing protein